MSAPPEEISCHDGQLEATMSIDHALWVHGHSAEIEYPDRLASMAQKGYHVRIEGNPSTTNWLHFAVPTAVIVDDYRMQPRSILFRYKTDDGGSVEAVHVYDGETRIATDDSPTGTVDADGWTRIRVHVDGDEILAVRWGIGISIKMRFGMNGGRLEFESAGCDFESANRVSCQRLRISTDKKHSLEFPYRSNMPTDVPNDAIERILISKHGTGGNAELYLRNGLAAAGLVAGALDNTLIIAPQFIYSREYYGRFPADLLHWDGGRAYGAESTERDRNCDGVPESGTLSSFTVMDTLLERVSRQGLFPNLKTIVLAGQSNGGQFVNRYAATSRFEQEVAAPRRIHMRYVVMNPGSYLYFNGERAVPGETGVFEVPDGCEGYDDWPYGLADLGHAGGGWAYPKRVGARAIRDQYPGRDVIYLIGALDTEVERDPHCKDALQGRHRLEKSEIYFNYLQHYFGSALQHERHVVTGVGHSGHGTMTSAEGLAALFGPVT
jgi:hypothetical protein